MRSSTLWLAWLLLLAAAPVRHAAVDELAAYMREGPLYRTAEQLIATIKSLAGDESSYIRVQELKAKDGSLFGALSSVPYQGGAPARPLMMITCGLHAREVFASELCLWLLRTLAGDVDTLLSWPEVQASLLGTGKLGSTTSNTAALRSWVGRIRQRLDVLVVPNCNPEGRAAVESGAFGTRKNAAGVDLNRNWPTGFSNSSRDRAADPKGYEYRGPTPLSEWETQALYAAAERLRPAAFLDVHTGMESIMTPWGHKFSLRDIPDATLAAWQPWLDAMNGPLQVAASPGGSQLYLTPGSIENTLYGQLGARYSMVVEAYGADNEGRGWKCPPLAAFKKACSEANKCGSTNCRRRDGTLVVAEGSRRRALLQQRLTQHSRRLAAADAGIAATNSSKRSSSSGSSTAWRSSSAGPRPQPARATTAKTPLTGLRTSVRQAPSGAAAAGALPTSDPFLRRLAAGKCTDCNMFPFFNPDTAARYRSSVGRWLAGLLMNLDHLATHL